MKTIADYLDAYAAANNCPSDYAIAKKLHISKQAVSRYRHGLSMPDNNVCWSIADALGVPPVAVIAASEIQRAECAKDTARLAVWRSRLSSLSTHGEKIFSVLAALPVAIWTVSECILCQIAQLPEKQRGITLPSLRPHTKSVDFAR